VPVEVNELCHIKILQDIKWWNDGMSQIYHKICLHDNSRYAWFDHRL